jgi:hypothetical protein
MLIYVDFWSFKQEMNLVLEQKKIVILRAKSHATVTQNLISLSDPECLGDFAISSRAHPTSERYDHQATGERKTSLWRVFRRRILSTETRC